ncbi:DNA alkylation repair protein [Flavobacterium cellulosilyticum]|uniref:DNA alkylation repair protein n=1 Tax=Flavobacterium cellulosilyticum TaxID=2541731 RepID=A0A4V2YZN9_9FLAO|nr:DNA alkylation repair protein [Flavobacterium cellulosilyticum]TDD97957.1 DNA alkylation repair protein [Flavobacterium cellulosilyticum]
MPFIRSLEKAFQEKSNPENAAPMVKYLRNQFSFFGLKTEERRTIFKAIWKENQEEVTKNPRAIALDLYEKSKRELHYCSIEILIKQLKGNYKKEDIQLIEKILITNSWWDSVDTIAKYFLGEYLVEFPLETINVIERFSNSDNMWLNRSAIIFQLGYKQKTNFKILTLVCERHKDSNEFFIQKAIGWALREYGKTNPAAVRNFVINANLTPLSTKEALKNIG